MLNLVKLPVRKSNVALRVAKGHFATSHSHINYLIDVTFQKSRLSEAQAVAKALVKQYVTSTIVDTIVCLDGMQVGGSETTYIPDYAGYGSGWRVLFVGGGWGNGGYAGLFCFNASYASSNTLSGVGARLLFHP